MNAPCDPPSNDAAGRGAGFPKNVRILRSSDFRTVYDRGRKYGSPYFAAFCLARDGEPGPKVGFTVPRALGKAVARNRIRRRMREAVRLELGHLPERWMVVFNPRRSVRDATFEQLRTEVGKLFLKCGTW